MASSPATGDQQSANRSERSILTKEVEPGDSQVFVSTHCLYTTESKTLSRLLLIATRSNVPASPSYDVHYRSANLSHVHRDPDISISHTSKTEIAGRAGFHTHTASHAISYPRARLTVNPSLKPGHEIPIEMAAPDFDNWTFTCYRTRYAWRLRKTDACLELASLDFSPAAASPVIARFTFARFGAAVRPGGEVGKLEIWEDVMTEREIESEVVIMGCLTVVRYLEGSGRLYGNARGSDKGQESARAHHFHLFHHHSSPDGRPS